MSRFLIWLAARLVPRSRRAEWVERWRAELVALERTPNDGGRRISTPRFAAGSLPDAAVEAADGWREGWSLSGLVADVRDGYRASRRAPGSTLLSIGILGLGTAAAACIFGFADATILRPPPGLAEPERLVQLGRKDAANFDNFSYPNYRDLRDGLADTVELAGWANTSVVVGDGLDARVLPAQAVTVNYLRVVGVPVTQGSGFTGFDDADFIGRSEAVVSATFWRDHAAAIRADNGIVTLNGQPFSVVGVTADGFAGVDVGRAAPDLWIPLVGVGSGAARLTRRDWSWMHLVGRVQPGVSMAVAREATMTVHARLAAEFDTTIGQTATFVEGVGLDPPSRALATQLLSVFMAIALLVLLVAAANVAGLQFSRGLNRRHEFAVRLSLGASRRRLLRALLVEQALLAAGAGVVAFGVTYWTAGWLYAALPYDISVPVTLTARLLVFALLVSIAAATLLAAWPLRSVTRAAPGDVLKAKRPDATRLRAGRVLVGIELAVSALLLVLGGMLMRSAIEAGRVDPGFETDRRLVVTIRRQPGRTTSSSVVVDDLRRRLESVPGVTGVGAATALPVVDPQSSRAVVLPEAAYDSSLRRLPVITANVDSGFFGVLGLELLEGRWLEPQDRVGDEIPVVINQSLANRLFPDGGSTGQRFVNGPFVYRVVGVAGPTALRSLRDRSLPAMWVPLDPRGETPSRIVLATSVDPTAVAGSVRAALVPLAHEVLLRRIEPLAPLVATSLSDTILASRLTLIFSIGALLMATVGLYGVSSAQVSRRKYEFGVRLALGADRRAVTGAVVRSAIVDASIGSALGVAGAWLAGPQLQALLFNVGFVDPLVVIATVAVLSTVSAVASIGPARRAGRTDPLIVIRAE